MEFYNDMFVQHNTRNTQGYDGHRELCWVMKLNRLRQNRRTPKMENMFMCCKKRDAQSLSRSRLHAPGR